MWIFPYIMFLTPPPDVKRAQTSEICIPSKLLWAELTSKKVESIFLSLPTPQEPNKKQRLKVFRTQFLDISFNLRSHHCIVGFAKNLSIIKLCLSCFLFGCFSSSQTTTKRTFLAIESNSKFEQIKFLVSIKSIVPSLNKCDVSLWNMLML